MARPLKKGLSYFNFDVDLFSDRKIRRLIRVQNGFTVFAYCLSAIYKEGYYIEYDEHFVFEIADMLHLNEQDVSDIIDYCAEINLFDAGLLDRGILTSHGIQSRYSTICTDARRQFKMDEYNLLNPIKPTVETPPTQPINGKMNVVTDLFPHINNNYSNTSTTNTPVNDTLIEVNEELSTQSKVKESKENESKANTTENHLSDNNKNLSIEQEILIYLNTAAGAEFRLDTISHIRFIKARLADNWQPQDLKDVIDYKCLEWKNDPKMCDYLTPDTLFNSVKFPKYAEQVRRAKLNPTKLHDKLNASINGKTNASSSAIRNMSALKSELSRNL
jgi:uncharacterized phage protein (TIGR02220 family)